MGYHWGGFACLYERREGRQVNCKENSCGGQIKQKLVDVYERFRKLWW